MLFLCSYTNTDTHNTKYYIKFFLVNFIYQIKSTFYWNIIKYIVFYYITIDVFVFNEFGIKYKIMIYVPKYFDKLQATIILLTLKRKHFRNKISIVI